MGPVVLSDGRILTRRHRRSLRELRPGPMELQGLRTDRTTAPTHRAGTHKGGTLPQIPSMISLPLRAFLIMEWITAPTMG
jgi:hypothetical protein